MKAATWLLVGAVTLAAPGVRAQHPISGMPVPELSFLDEPIQTYLDTTGVHAAVVGIAKDGDIVYLRGFGWRDRDLGDPLQETATLRVGSVTKTFTAAVIRDLSTTGEIELDGFAFDLGQSGGGYLDLEPFPGPQPGDSRLAEITVNHLLFHQGGWDRNGEDGDLLGRGSELLIKEEMGLDHLPTQEETMRWILGRPLQFTPGDETVYSSLGYLVLGLIIHQVAGSDLLDYVQAHLLSNALWYPAADLFQGRGLLEFQDPREPYYNHEELWTNVYRPDEEVFAPYGGWNHELKEAYGGVVASAIPLLDFAHRYYLSGIYRGLPIQTPQHVDHGHGGALFGSRADLWGDAAGYDIVVLTNRYGTGPPDSAQDIRALVQNALDSASFTWPTETVDCRWLDFSYAGPEEGSHDRPFNGIDDLTGVPAWSKVKIKPGFSAWTGIVADTHLRLSTTRGGSVVIGQ